jgi:hypothetical protein
MIEFEAWMPLSVDAHADFEALKPHLEQMLLRHFPTGAIVLFEEPIYVVHNVSLFLQDLPPQYIFKARGYWDDDCDTV